MIGFIKKAIAVSVLVSALPAQAATDQLCVALVEMGLVVSKARALKIPMQKVLDRVDSPEGVALVRYIYIVRPSNEGLGSHIYLKCQAGHFG